MRQSLQACQAHQLASRASSASTARQQGAWQASATATAARARSAAISGSVDPGIVLSPDAASSQPQRQSWKVKRELKSKAVWLTRNIVHSRSLADLEALLNSHAAVMNHIHVAAACVKVAKLLGADQTAHAGDAQQHSRKRTQSQASSSTTAPVPVPGNTPSASLISSSTIAGQPHDRVEVSTSPSPTPNVDVTALAARLQARYLVCASTYSTARQHINICWALSELHLICGLPPAPGVLDTMEACLLESQTNFLATAVPQELANLALALARLGYLRPALWTALADAVTTQTLTFKPQELSNLAWGAATAHHQLSAHAHKLSGFSAAVAAAVNSLPLSPAATQPPLPASHMSQHNNATSSSGHSTSLSAPPPLPDASATPAVHPLLAANQLPLHQHMLNIVELSIEMAATRVHEFKPKELAILLWAAGKCKCNTWPGSPARAFCMAARPQMAKHVLKGHANCQDMSNSAWAYARLQLFEEGRMLMGSVSMALLEPDASQPMPLQQQPSPEHPDSQLQQPRPMQHDNTIQQPSPSQEQQQQQRSPSQEQQQQHPSSPKEQLEVEQAGNPNRFSLRSAIWGDQELCNLLWASATLGCAGPICYTLAASLAEELGRRAQQLTSQGLANTAWAAARLGLLDGVLWGSLLEALGPQAHTCRPQELSNMLWTATRLPADVALAPKHSAALASVIAAAQRQSSAMSPTGLAQLAWACGWVASSGVISLVGWDMPSYSPRPQSAPSVVPLVSQQQGGGAVGGGSEWHQLLSRVCLLSGQQLHAFSSQDLSMLAQGLSLAMPGPVHGEGRALLNAVGDAAVGHVTAGAMTPGGLAGLLAALARAGVRHRQLGSVAAQATAARLELYAPHELANLMSALAVMRVRDKLLLDKVAQLLLAGPGPGQPSRHTFAPSSGPVPNAASGVLPHGAQPIMTSPPGAAAAYGDHIVLPPPTEARLQSVASAQHGTVSSVYGLTQEILPAAGDISSDEGSGSSGSEAQQGDARFSGSESDGSRGGSMDEEALQPRSQAKSLLRQLGWEEDQDEGIGVESREGGLVPTWPPLEPLLSAGTSLPAPFASNSQSHASQIPVSSPGDQPWAHQPPVAASGPSQPWTHQPGEPWPADTALLDASRLDWSPAGQAWNGPGMVWTVLAWAFARSNYHQHRLYDRLADAVLLGTEPARHGASNVTSGGRGSQRASVSSRPAVPPHPPRMPVSPEMAAALSAPGSGVGEGRLRARPSQPSPPPPHWRHVAELSRLTTPCVVQLLWALAVHHHSHPALLAAAAPVLTARILRQQLSAREVACVAWVYARLQRYEPRLFSAVLREAITHSDRYNLRHWSRLAWAFSTLSLPSEEAFFVRLEQLQRRQELLLAGREERMRSRLKNRMLLRVQSVLDSKFRVL